MALLEISDLSVRFHTDDGPVHAVDRVSFALEEREVLAVVGESGCGKSVTAMSLMRLLPGTAQVSGSARFDGRDLIAVPDKELRAVRGREIAFIFQEPMTSLNPALTIGKQIGEVLRRHLDMSGAQARERTIELLDLVGIPAPQRRVGEYPHQLSGGMRQRVMIAMALACDPKVLIADEPTTALDVTIQAQILRELGTLRDETGAGIILVTHDLGVVADVADRVIVMYAGRVVEQGTLDELFYDPQHPYTWGLLGSITRVDRDRSQKLPAIPGQPPSLLSPPEGCHFRPRCPHEFAKCKEVPPLESRLPESRQHRDRCWLSPEDKRERRLVDGEIGLPSERAVTS